MNEVDLPSGTDGTDLVALGAGLFALGGAGVIVLGLLRAETVVVVTGSAALMSAVSILLLLVAQNEDSDTPES